MTNKSTTASDSNHGSHSNQTSASTGAPAQATTATSESNNNNNINNNNNNNDLQVRDENKLVASGVGAADRQHQREQAQVESKPPHAEQDNAVEQTIADSGECKLEAGTSQAEVGGSLAEPAPGVKRPAESEVTGGQDEPPGDEGATKRPKCEGTTNNAQEEEAAQVKLEQGVEVEEEEVPALVSHEDVMPSAVRGEPPPEARAAAAAAATEYTMLTPASTNMTGGGGGQQPPTVGLRTNTSSTILTDLDASKDATALQQQQQQQTNQQDGSTGATETMPVKIEAAGQDEEEEEGELQPPPPLSGGPLTELTPAAVGTTFSELTSVNPVSIHELHAHHHHQHPHPHPHLQQQQQQQHHNQQHHHQHHHPNEEQHEQHQMQQIIHHHHHHQQQQPHQQQGYLIQASDQQHLMQPGDPQQQQHHLVSAYSINSQSPFLVANTMQPQQQEQVASQAAPGPGDLSMGGDSSQPALPTGRKSFSQTTGPPSVGSSVATEASGSVAGSKTTSTTGGGGGGGGKRRAWSQMNRQANKTEIAKVFAPQSFRCYLEAPISTCRRKEEDRITYINKGEFYGLTLDYLPDPQRPIRSNIVKAVVMLVFREDKTLEDDMKSWQFWHSRQHSAKQRILDVDNKNHVNVINQIEEVSLNAIAFYWNPVETRQAKLNIAIQCLSTDFSNQKGVKGLPLNLQVDIYDLFTETSTPVYRAYATLLSYCDKGAQRRSRDEERRALKRKLTDQAAAASAGSAKKFDDMYHKPCDRSEFYAMADLVKAPTLYNPTEQEALGLAASEHSSSSTATTATAGGGGGGGGGGGTTPAGKQPMSQASGLSVTPLSATTPIPLGGTTPVAVVASGTPTVVAVAADTAGGSIPNPAPTGGATSYVTLGQPGGGQAATAGVAPPVMSATAVGGPAGPRQSAPFGLNQPQVVGHAPGPYGTIITTDYMTPHATMVSVGAPMIPGGAAASMVSMSPIQQQQQQQQHLAHQSQLATGQQQQQQQLQHMGQMMGQGQQMSQGHHHPQQQQQQQQHHAHQQQHQQQQLQHPTHQQQQQHQHQQHQHYHTMTGGPHQTPYGIIQTSTPNDLQQQHQQQYALLQPSMTTMVQQAGGPHPHPHSHGQMMSHQQQQQQQHSMDPSRHHQVIMGAGGGGVMQHHSQYGQPAPPAGNLVSLQTPAMSQQQQAQQQQSQPFAKRSKLYPDERVLIYAKQADEKDFYPLHLSPPSLGGLVYAIEQKYKIDSSKIANIYKKSKKGIRVQMDDEMIRHYCNEDMVQLEVIQTSDSRLEITLVEL